VDQDAFDALIEASDPSMVVVAARAEGEVDACLVGFHTQCSIDPLRYAVWLSKANHTYHVAKRAGLLAVHWLPQGDLSLASRVGSVTLDGDRAKMDALAWHVRPDGAVELDGARGLFVGRVVGVHDDGDHVCFVLEPVDAHGEQGAVLRFSEARRLDAGHDADPSVPPRSGGASPPS
jgi:flavin reductase (DIM6/NTAB) family NADH-FMN oxidoreductase RutF